MMSGNDAIAKQDSLPNRDIPWLLSKIALQEIRRLPPHKRIDNDFWEQLKVERPNLADFLVSASYQIAPDDAEFRAEIASFGVGLVMLLSDATANPREIRPVIELSGANTGLISAGQSDDDESEPPAA
jgi:hypothetical protein